MAGPARAARGALADLVGVVASGSPGFGAAVDGAALASTVAAVEELAALDAWVGEVAGAVRAADRVGGRVAPPSGIVPGVIVGPEPGGGTAVEGSGRRVQVVRSGAGGRTRVVRLALGGDPVALDAAAWAALAATLAPDPAGPLHLLVHGWGTATAGAVRAGEATADLADRAGVAGTVVVVDWEAGEGAGAGWWRAPWDYTVAERAARRAAEPLAALLAALGARRPEVPVTVTAHSLGVDLVARALTVAGDRVGAGVDLLALQPALPTASALDARSPHRALAGLQVASLTLTTNPDDQALGWYEVRGPAALGDEGPASAAVAELARRRRELGLPTDVVAHRSRAGGGHLSLWPHAAQPLVRHLTSELHERAARGAPGPLADIRRTLLALWPEDAEELLRAGPLATYLEEQAEAGRAPSFTDAVRLVEAHLGPSVGPRP